MLLIHVILNLFQDLAENKIKLFSRMHGPGDADMRQHDGLFMASDSSHVFVSHNPEFISGSPGAKNKLFQSNT